MYEVSDINLAVGPTLIAILLLLEAALYYKYASGNPLIPTGASDTDNNYHYQKAGHV